MGLFQFKGIDKHASVVIAHQSSSASHQKESIMSVRFGARTSKNTGVSVGPVAALILFPFTTLWVMLVLAYLAFYAIGWLCVKAVKVVFVAAIAVVLYLGSFVERPRA